MHSILVQHTVEVVETDGTQAQKYNFTWLRLPYRIGLFGQDELIHGVGQVELNSLEEAIWRELGALPLSRR